MDRLPQKFEVRDFRDGGWIWIYKTIISDPHLSAQDVRVYAALACFDGENHEIYPSYEAIANMSQLSRRTVIRSIKYLMEVGYLTLIKGGGRNKTNYYNLLKNVKGCQKCTVSKRVSETTQKGVRDDKKTVSELHPNNIYIIKKEKEPAGGPPGAFDPIAAIDGQLLKATQPGKRIIGLFLKHRIYRDKYKLESQDELNSWIRPNIQVAKMLDSLGYEDEFYTGLFGYAAHELERAMPDSGGEIRHMETVRKYLSTFKSQYPGYKKRN